MVIYGLRITQRRDLRYFLSSTLLSQSYANFDSATVKIRGRKICSSTAPFFLPVPHFSPCRPSSCTPPHRACKYVFIVTFASLDKHATTQAKRRKEVDSDLLPGKRNREWAFIFCSAVYMHGDIARTTCQITNKVVVPLLIFCCQCPTRQKYYFDVPWNHRKTCKLFFFELVWSPLSASWASTRHGCQSCSGSDEQEKCVFPPVPDLA